MSQKQLLKRRNMPSLKVTLFVSLFIFPGLSAAGQKSLTLTERKHEMEPQTGAVFTLTSAATLFHQNEVWFISTAEAVFSFMIIIATLPIKLCQMKDQWSRKLNTSHHFLRP